ncbi:MAG: O-antigen ligase family protein [Candidatus Kapaibacteriales bacterium]
MLILFFIQFPRMWIYFTIIGFGILLIQRGENVSIFEVIIYGISVSGLLIYFVSRLFILRTKIVQNIGDFLIILFFVFSIFNSFIAYLNGVDLIRWAREYFTLFLVLLYFPIREYIIDVNHIRIFFIAVIIAIMFAILDGFLTFRNTALLQAVYAYQLGSSIKMNQVVFGAAILSSVVFAIYNKNFLIRLFLLLFALSSIAALVLTYSRTFWLVVMLELCLLLLFVKKSQKFRIILYATIFTLGVVFSTLFVFKQNAEIVFKLIEKRFISSAKYRTDLSVLSRKAEYPVVYRGIRENVLWGSGFAKEIRFHDPIYVRTNIKPIIHNGFTSLAFRVGIPLALLYWLFIFFYLAYSVIQFLRTKIDAPKPFYLSSALSLILFIVSNFTFQQYIYREGIFSVFISIALIFIPHKMKQSSQL